MNINDERDQISKNDEERVTNDIELLKLGQFGYQKSVNNIERESDEINRMDIIDDERDQIEKSKKMI